MIQRLLLFPSSPYLREQWWHRLATVVFWAWFIAVLIGAIHWLVLVPFNTCIGIKFNPNYAQDIDCGSNAFHYAYMQASSESPSSALFGALILIAVAYIALLIPGITYRVSLYVAKGSNWRDVPTPPHV